MIRYLVLAALSVFGTSVAYFGWFYHLGEPLSTKSSTWGEFGSYFGGILGPILSFISLFFLIQSLRLQNEANLVLKQEAKDSEKTEYIRSFSAVFFNMVDSQKAMLDRLKIDHPMPDGSLRSIVGVDAVFVIEDAIELIRGHAGDDAQISAFIEDVDATDVLFGVIRAFYITVKMITDKLSDKNGFSADVRSEFLNTLINFTDFAQLRLVLVMMQFSDSEAAKYLNNNDEFLAVLADTRLAINSY